jgi:hypothetical protein
MAGWYERGNKLPAYVRGGKFLYLLRDSHLLKEVSVHGLSYTYKFRLGFRFRNVEIVTHSTHLTRRCHYDHTGSSGSL